MTGSMANSTRTSTQHLSMATGMFRDREEAERAYNLAGSRGYDKDDISVLMSDDTRKKQFSEGSDLEPGSKAFEGAGAAGVTGGAAREILAATAAVGASLSIPGLGIVVAGPMAAALTGSGTGGLSGSLIDALVRAGIPKERAEAYDAGIREGGIVLGLTPRNAEDAEYFEREWNNKWVE